MTQYVENHFGQYAYDRYTRERVQPGAVVTDFRGEKWTYMGVDTPAYGRRSGRLTFTRRCPSAYATYQKGWECVHMWHRGGMETGWRYPGVFNLYLADENGVEA